jgi:NDP-sugar pyrophosphorylase family protein
MVGDRAGRAAAVIGFCLAAGAGTRLWPLTRAVPKPLLAPAGRPLVDLAVEALQAAGATRVVVNAHHGADQLVALLAGRAGVEVVVEPVLLGTGGGLVNAARLGLLGDGDDPVLVTAADHVVDPADLASLAAFLDQAGTPMAAGLVSATTDPFGLRLEAPAPDPPPDLRTPSDPPARGLWTADPSAPGVGLRSPTGGPGTGPPGTGAASITDWPGSGGSGAGAAPISGGPGTGCPGAGAESATDAGPGSGRTGGRVVRDPDGGWDSAGMYAVRAGLLCDLEPGYATLVGRVLGPLLEAGRLVGLPVRGPVADAGTLARLLDVSAGLLTGRWSYALPSGRLVRLAPAGSPPVLQEPVFAGAGAEVDPAALLAGPVVLDAGCRVGAGAVVTRSVVGPRAVVGAGARVVGSFLGPGSQVPPGVSVTSALVPGPTRD